MGQEQADASNKFYRGEYESMDIYWLRRFAQEQLRIYPGTQGGYLDDASYKKKMIKLISDVRSPAQARAEADARLNEFKIRQEKEDRDRQLRAEEEIQENNTVFNSRLEILTESLRANKSNPSKIEAIGQEI